MMRAVRLIVLCATMVIACVPAASSGGDGSVSTFPVPDGWSVQVDSAAYGPDDLWEYIDGAADLFVLYGFERLECATYRTRLGGEVRAEVYRHADGANAYGMYSQERSPENAAVDCGNEGCADVGMMNVVIGRWYIKMSAPPAVPREDLLLLAGFFDRLHGSPRGLAAEFASLPSAGRIPRSEQFIARDFLGYGFLSRVFLARYGDGEGAQVFVIRTGSADAAGRIRESFIRAAGGKSTAAGPAVTHLIDPHHGGLDLVLQGSDVYGLLGCGNNESLRLALLKNLQ